MPGIQFSQAFRHLQSQIHRKAAGSVERQRTRENRLPVLDTDDANIREGFAARRILVRPRKESPEMANPAVPSCSETGLAPESDSFLANLV
jgi:hypothetical protein